MKRLFAAVAPFVLLFGAGAADATAYVLNGTVDFSGKPTTATSYTVSISSLSTAITSLVAGDTISGTLSFSTPFTLTDVGSMEQVQINMSGSASGLNLKSTLTLLDTSGQANFTSQTASTGGAPFMAMVGNITNSRVTFDGVSFTTTVTSGSASNIQLWQLNTSAGSLASVPEPTSWSMMILGFGAIGISLRHRNKAAVALG